MNPEIYAKEQPDSTIAARRLASRLDQLKTKLKSFAVIDSEGRFVGEVSDLILDDQRRLHLLISQPDVNQGQRLFLVPSRVVTWVRSRAHTLSITLTQATIRQFPDYQPLMQPSDEPVFDAIADDNPPSAIDLTSLEGLETQPSAAAEGLVDYTDLPKSVAGEVVQEETIRLLEERIAVDYSKQKIGEVIVRKEIETRMIQVPVRREKLIVEQISPTYKQLAEIDLGQGEIEGVELRDYQPERLPASSTSLIVSGEFDSPQTGAWLLDSIAHQAHHSCQKIRIEIEVEDPSHFDLYQGWFDRCSIRKDQPD